MFDFNFKSKKKKDYTAEREGQKKTPEETKVKETEPVLFWFVIELLLLVIYSMFFNAILTL